METVGQITGGALLIGLAILCGLAIFVLGVIIAIVRSGVLADLLAGLSGTASLINDDPAPMPATRRQGGDARKRAAQVRAQIEREFYGDQPPPRDRPSADSPPSEGGLPELERDKRAWRRRSREDDRDDELDAFLDDMEL
ncbi:MAG: hypothetical protein Kow0077_26980 [Anaerolineae bacterium]